MVDGCLVRGFAPGSRLVRRGARLAAGFNRSLMLTHPDQPNGTSSGDYYQGAATNHWSRVVHANTPIGYAFPYGTYAPTASRTSRAPRTTATRGGSR